MQIVIAFVLAFALAVFGARVFHHQTEATPALVTPQMNLHTEFSNDLDARFARLATAVQQGSVVHRKLIALTFDDGPYPMFTPLLLDELKRMNVPATFFLIGRDAEQWPAITRRIESDGNEVADHTYSHPNLDQETPGQVKDELIRGRDVLWNLTHDPSVRDLMRPPHGRYTLATLRATTQLGYQVVLWTDDSGDWRTITPEQIQRDMLQHATSPDIVLLHSGKLATIEALPSVVQRFRAAGYTFVTAGELLRSVTPYSINHPDRHAL